MYFSCIELVIQRTIKLSYFGLIDARVSGSYKYLPVQQQQLISFEAMNYVFTITLQYKSSLATRKKLPSLIDHINGLTTLHFLYCKMNYCLFTPPTKKNQWYFISKIVLTYNEKKLFQWSRKTSEIRGWSLRIVDLKLEQFIQISSESQYNFWNRMLFKLVPGGFSDLIKIRKIRIQIGKN